MVNLEQIRLLESRVQHVIGYVQKLRDENTQLKEGNSALRESLEKYEKRIGDLESLVSEFKAGQDEIEQSITSALSQLDQLEDKVLEEPPAYADEGKPTNKKSAAATATGSANNQKQETAAKPATQPSSEPEMFVADSVDVDEIEEIYPEDEEPEQRSDSESELDIF